MKTQARLVKSLLAITAIAALWETGASLWEKRRWRAGANYWRAYYSNALVRRSEALRREETLLSTGVRLHLDIYPRPEPDAPVIVFNHGAAGYCRLFVPLVLAFYDRGYTVILPDQRGQGLSGGRRGNYTVTECVQNIVDIAHWARRQFSGSLYLAGGSVGGAYTYYAAAAGAPAQAIACLKLFDFGCPTDGLGISRLSGLAHFPLAASLSAGFRLLAPMGWLRLPFAWFGAFDRLMDGRDQDFQAAWDADPIPPRLVTLRSLASTLTTPPRVPFECNKMPALVINQSMDQMVDPAVTKRNCDRLAGPKCYLEIPFGHWSSQPAFWEAIVKACDEWFRQYGSPRYMD